MAAHNGILVESPICTAIPSHITVSIRTPLPSVPVVGGANSTSAEALSGARSVGSRAVATARNGVMAPSFKDIWYNRIHLTPNSFDLGPVLSSSQLEFILWNAYIDDRVSCSAINETGFNGIILHGATAPFNLNKLAYTEYTVDVEEIGGAIIDCVIEYVVDDGSYFVYITGNRLTVFQWRPEGNIIEKLGWYNEVLKSKRGKEQRICGRSEPRQEFTFDVALKSRLAASIYDSKMFRWQKRAFAVPVWTEQVEVFDTISIGATEILFDTSFADFRDDGIAVLWKSETEFEILSIGEVLSDRLVLTNAVANEYTGIKVVCPAVICNCVGNAKKSITADGMYAKLKLNFASIDNIELSGHVQGMTYDGMEVMLRRPYVEGSLESNTDAEFVVSDFQTGRVKRASPTDFNSVTQDHLFYNDSKEDCWRFRLFLHSLRGRQKVVLYPTFMRDLELMDDVGPADQSIVVNNIGLSNDMGFNTFREYVALINIQTGAIDHVNRITGISNIDASTELITLADLAGAVYGPTTHCVCFVDKCRLSLDEVTMKWEFAHRNECKLGLKRVEE